MVWTLAVASGEVKPRCGNSDHDESSGVRGTENARIRKDGAAAQAAYRESLADSDPALTP